jgi:hypothetical protein
MVENFSLWFGVHRFTGSAADTTNDYAGSATNTAKDYAGSAVDTTKDYAGKAHNLVSFNVKNDFELIDSLY